MGGNNTHSLSMVIKTVLGSSIQSVINSDTERNPKAFSLTEYQKEYILKAVNNEETVAMIVEKLQISPFKIRQFLLLKGINNFQKYKGNKKWKIKHEKWSLLEK